MSKPRSFDVASLKSKKGKIAVLAAWFVSILAIRLLLGLAFSSVWVGTLGAIAITFGIFYFALRYTVLAKYSNQVNNVLQSWYRKKYVMWGLISSMTILGSLVFMIEYGYAFHSDRVVSFGDLSFAKSIDSARARIDSSMQRMFSQGYSGIDVMSIVIASVDKSLDGHYLQMIMFIFAEDMEVLAFLVLIKRTAGRNLFGTVPART